MDPSFIPYRLAAAYLKSRLDSASKSRPVVGIICGSGLSGLSRTLIDTLTIPYRDIPGFPPHCTVAGHEGELVFGTLADGSVSAVCLRGRFHSYEGHDMNTVTLPVRVMRCLGVKVLIVTNAAGGLNSSYKVGDVVSITDHIALPMLSGKNPLVGPNDDDLGPRFPPTSDAYNESLQSLVVKAAEGLAFSDFVKVDGTYCFVSGPMYESRAECRFLRSQGGDCVGMSTVPEVVAAHHCGMKVVCLSLITNKVVITGHEGPVASHGEVLDAVNKRSEQMQSLVKAIVKELSESGILARMPELPPVNLDVTKVGQGAGLKCIPLCPYHIIKGTPSHCIIMGCAMIALGSIVTLKLARK